MSIFPVHTRETAPEASHPVLDGAREKYGFVPNLMGALAESPALLEGYVTLMGILDKTAFTAVEKHVILLAASAENGCAYCVAAHSTAATAGDVPGDVITALRDGRPLADVRLEALRAFIVALVAKRGWVSDDDVQAFLGAGYERAQVLDAVLAVTAKTLSNYANHIIGTPVDSAFRAHAWSARKVG